MSQKMLTETGRFSATREITGSGASEKKTRASNTFDMTGKDGASTKKLHYAYEKSGLKSSKNAIYNPKSGKKFKYSDSSIRPSYGANQVQTVWDRAVVNDPSSSHYGQVYDKKIISGCHGINQNHVKDSGIWSI